MSSGSRECRPPLSQCTGSIDTHVGSGSFPDVQEAPLYFDREDVKKAIHAPVSVDWTECSNINVFPDGDGSLPPAFTVLPNVIEKSNRTVIVHGLADFILIAEGCVLPYDHTLNGLSSSRLAF